MSLSASSRSHYLAVFTLLGQLALKEYDGEWLPIILEGRFSVLPRIAILDLFCGKNSNIEFSQIVSKFLMDRHRAGSLWVNLQMYVNLTTPLLKILCDK